MKARSLTGPPVSVGVGTGRRLVEDLKVDLGIHLPELQLWAKRWDRLGNIYSSHDGTTVFMVPRDFTTIGPGPASIPWFLFPVLGDRENYEIAGWVHDAAYRWRVPQSIADWLFWWIARSGTKQVNSARANLVYYGLRAFGGLIYGDFR